MLEAARTDGANERQIFFRIILPMVSLPISVLAVTLIVNVIKLFDLIYVLTNGGPGTSSRVIAFTMYNEGLPGGQFGKRRGGRRDHALAARPGDGLQRPPLPQLEGRLDDDAVDRFPPRGPRAHHERAPDRAVR